MVNPFQPAVREQMKLRLAINGVAGSGKTFTSLKIASHMVAPGRRDDGLARIAFIDSERGSARLYADVDGFQPFDVLELQANSDGVITPQQYLDAIAAARQYGYDFLIIDSLSHAWEGVLDMKDKIDRAKPSSNSYTNWRQITPVHNKLVDSILSYPGHVIAAMRVKMEHVIEKDDNGKTTVRKVGLKSVMRDGVEYEFSIVLDMQDDNSAHVTKTRCMELTGQILNKPGVELAETLNAWLGTGIEPQPKQEQPWTKPEMQTFMEHWRGQGWNDAAILKVLGVTRLSEWQQSLDAADAALVASTDNTDPLNEYFPRETNGKTA